MIRSLLRKRISIVLLGAPLLTMTFGCAGALVGDSVKGQEQRQYERQPLRIEQKHAILDGERRERLRQRGDSSSERYELINIELLDTGQE